MTQFEDPVVLVVDDDPAISHAIEMLLKDGLGAHVLFAYDGEAAITEARAARPAVAILDLHLPRLDGLEVARRLKSDPDTAGIALVALSGSTDTRDHDLAKAAGFDAYVDKPFSFEELLRTVQQYLDKGGLTQKSGDAIPSSQGSGDAIPSSMKELPEQ